MKKPLLLLTALATLILSSCTHYYYVPSTKNVPLLKKKGDLNFTGVASSASYSNAYELQGAYAVTDNFGIMGTYMLAEGGMKEEHNWGKGNYMDFGVGYFKPFGKYRVVEIYSGVGTCVQSHLYNYYSNNYPNYFDKASSKLSFNKLFIQPSFGFKGRIAELAYTTGLSYLTFNNISHNISPSELEYKEVQSIMSNRRALLVESALTFRIGWKFVKFQIQAQGVRQLQKPKLQLDEGLISVGLNFAIAN